MAQEKIRTIITQLKKLKEEKNLTINEILDILDKTNNHLSRPTVIKIFSEGSEDYGYQYDTIRTLSDTLFGVYSNEDDENAEIKGLKSTIQYQNIIIDQLNSQIEQMKAQIDNLESSAHKRIDFLRDRVEIQDSRIEQKDRLITIMLMFMLSIKNSSSDLDTGIVNMLHKYFDETIDDIGKYLKKDDE